MSRQTQNVLMGGLACVVAAAAMLAATVMLTNDDGSINANIDPLAAGVSDVGGVEAGNSSATDLGQPTAATTPGPALAVAITSSSLPAGSSSTTSSVPVTTSTSSTSSTTTASTTTTTSTTASTSTETSVPGSSSTDTSADMTTTTEDPTSTRPSNGEPSTTAQQTTTTVVLPTTVSSGSLNEFEREIARLTNELRTNPNGLLKRQGAVINCGGRIRVNMSSGQYDPISALTVHEGASLQVARPWSAQMSRSNFNHQPNAGVGALQNIGISVRSAGENIAYHNYPDKALNHFTGWRESDGHFCNMMDPEFTHIGVGEVTKSDGISYATQNFFSLR